MNGIYYVADVITDKQGIDSSGNIVADEESVFRAYDRLIAYQFSVKRYP